MLAMGVRMLAMGVSPRFWSNCGTGPPPPWLGQWPKGPADSKAAASLHNKGVKSAHCIDKQLYAKEKGDETHTRDWHKLAVT